MIGAWWVLALAAPLLQTGELVLRPEWKPVGLPEQRLPVTRFAPALVEGRPALRIDAPASYGTLTQPLPPDATPRTLRWSWRVERASPAIALRTRAGDDSPARVCLSFDWPSAWLPFVEQQALRLAAWRSGRTLPGATLCWAWGGPQDAAGSVVDSPYTRRVRTIVLRSGSGGGWHDEVRDVAADLRRAFGDEWPAQVALPAAQALIVGADADNTASHSTAWVADLRLD